MSALGAFFLILGLGLLAYAVVILMLPARLRLEARARMQQALQKLRLQHAGQEAAPNAPESHKSEWRESAPAKAFVLSTAMHASPAGLRNVNHFTQAPALPLLLLAPIALHFGPVPALGAAGVVGACIWFYLRGRAKQYRRAFLAQFPDALDGIARSVRAGHSVTTAFRAVGDHLPPPLGAEFRRAAEEAHYNGAPAEAARHLARRIGAAEVHFLAVVLGMQQESGGNLSEALSNLSHVIRQRAQLRLRVRALSSEGRATAWIVGSLPLAFIALMEMLMPQQLSPLWDTGAGRTIGLIAAGMMAAGVFIIRRMVSRAA